MSMVRSSRIIVQGCRQAVGKSYVGAFIAALHIILGYKVVVAMPSLRQGSRILLRRILLWMLCLEPHVAIESIGGGVAGMLTALERRVDNALEVEWNNGGGLMAISTNEQAAAGVQGYTCTCLLIDEGAETSTEYFPTYSSLPDIALKRGYGKIIILGVGGPSESLIEVMKEKGYELEFWPDTAVVDLDPSWTEHFRQKELELTPDGYDQMYRCLPVSAGMRYIFPQLTEYVHSPGSGEVELIAGIDVGKRVDETVVVLRERRGEMHNIIGLHRIRGKPYPDQAVEIAEYLAPYTFKSGKMRPPLLGYNVGVETNGPGEGLADCLAREYPLGQLTRVWTSDKAPHFKKSGWIKSLMVLCQGGQFAVKDERARRELSALQFEIKDDGRYVWPHNDVLSALWVSQATAHRAYGV